MNESTQLYSYRFGQFELQPGERRLLAAGVPVAVQRRAFDVLVALVERAGHLVSKDELLSLVWPKLVVEESNLHVQVSALRKILGPTAIAAVSGQGYRFMWEVSREALDAVRPPPAAKLVRSRRWRWTAGSVAILLIGAGGAWWLSTETVHHLTSPALSSTLSITILPLDAPDDENLAKLLLPEITDAFGRNARSVRVTSPPMAASFRGKEADARAIGQSVDVRYVAAAKSAESMTSRCSPSDSSTLSPESNSGVKSLNFLRREFRKGTAHSAGGSACTFGSLCGGQNETEPRIAPRQAILRRNCGCVAWRSTMARSRARLRRANFSKKPCNSIRA